MKLNGLDIRLDFPEVSAICEAVTGPGGGAIASGTGFAAVLYFIWNGSNWALASATVPPLQNLSCNLAASLTSAVAQRFSIRTRGQVKLVLRSSSHGRKATSA
jgi:hypothetical protein